MDREAYLSLHESEERHWWFVARRKIIGKILSCYFPSRGLGAILEVGCGSGGNLGLLSGFGKLFAVEMDDYCIEMASARGICEVKKGYLPDNIPFDGKFDLVCMLDVLEHVEDDMAAMKAVSERLGENGKILITVPAYAFLWSNHDVVLGHKRRYTRKQLLDLLSKSGMRPVYSTYFNTFLMPLVVAVRAVGRLFGRKGADDNSTGPRFLDFLLQEIFSAERLAIPAISFPFGVSIMVVAERDK